MELSNIYMWQWALLAAQADACVRGWEQFQISNSSSFKEQQSRHHNHFTHFGNNIDLISRI